MTRKTEMPKALTDRMKLCCHWYALTGDEAEAARRSRLSSEQQKAVSTLLSSPAAQAYLAEIHPCLAGKREPEVQEGYRRLAFGSISDAVKLMFATEEEPPDIDRLDLFNVSELRRGKGALEISFFDRLDALDRLAKQQSEEESRGSLGFYEAVREGAAALEGKA